MALSFKQQQENLKERQEYETLRNQLELERSSFLPHWRELGDYILPRRPRFFVTDTNRGERRSQKIIDPTASLASRTLSSGMMSGLTSPARPWFKLTTPDPGVADFGPVKFWLQEVTRRMNTIFLRSNLYNTLPIVYSDLGVFGTAAMFIEEDMDNVIRTFALPIGSYSLANDDRLRVSVIFREFRMTVRQVVNKFAARDGQGNIDFSNISETTKNMYGNKNYEAWVNIVHIIKPNEAFQASNPFSKKYLSIYYERGAQRPQGGVNTQGSTIDEGKFLRKSGYDHFPVLAPRWEVTGEDSYGTSCPGMIALGDIKQLQTGEKRSLQAIEKKVNPPMIAPTALKRVKTSILPGDITYTDEREGLKGFRPVHDVNFMVSELEEKQNQCRQRISRSFFEDLFLMLTRIDRREITAREIEERHEEKLLALGPVLEQLNQDLLDPLIDLTFSFMLRQGLIPEPPEEIEGTDLRVEYVSIMAQAQKLVGIGAVERFASFAGNFANIVPSIIDKVNSDQMLDVYGELISLPAGVLRSDEEAQSLREEREERAREAQEAEAMQKQAAAASSLASAKTDESNALTELMGRANAGSIAPTEE
jgi:hypothetical protein